MSTGGRLNTLNGKYGISAAINSVPVMKLIRFHKPKSRDELVQLIESHNKKRCHCGVVSQGTIEDFGKNLYLAQVKEWNEYKYSLSECIQWEYELFITNSLSGYLKEDEALEKLKKEVPNYDFEEAEGYVDEELRVDIIIKKDSKDIAGIQVKPETYKNLRAGVHLRNITSNAEWGKPVLYLYYDDSGNFTNFREIVREINQLPA